MSKVTKERILDLKGKRTFIGNRSGIVTDVSEQYGGLQLTFKEDKDQSILTAINTIESRHISPTPLYLRDFGLLFFSVSIMTGTHLVKEVFYD